MSVPEILEAASGTESPKTPSTPTAPRSRHSFASDDASEKDPSPPSTPKKAVLQNRHAKLRLTRSYDPNVTRHRADRPHSCREPEHKQDVTDDNEHSILRPVKSLTLGGGNILHHIIESDSPISSPRSKKKYNYLQKMAMIFHGPKSPSSATSSPVYSDEECSVYSDSDFYFDNTSPIASPTVMHRGKLPSSASSRLIPKKWRFKSSSSKLVSCATATLWSSEGNCRWVSMSGRTVQLTNTLLPYVSDMERITLQKVALQRLQGYELGVITIPKDCSLKRSKKSNFSLKGRGKNSSFWDNFKDIGKENKDSGNGLVFGISLTKCISNDIALKRKRSTQRKERRESLDLANTVYRIKPANGKNNEAKEIVKRQVIASESSASTESNKSTANASLLDALSLSTSSSDCHRKEKRKALMVREPQVPHIVASCFKYIENHGIRVLGIFRVGGSKKRIKQVSSRQFLLWIGGGEGYIMVQSNTSSKGWKCSLNTLGLGLIIYFERND
uniref:Rho GTPase-activating protein 6-like n=1 Tax=Saccoglossus kowalevskii TaxID=10224 RepID=A0ABM0MI63_SACKO|nr:PREDICTED: rho GTPase-activating protein 6-like [Saccoglossus kowalevskii]